MRLLRTLLNNTQLQTCLNQNGFKVSSRLLATVGTRDGPNDQNGSSSSRVYTMFGVLSGIVLGTTVIHQLNSHPLLAETEEHHKVKAGVFRKDLPMYTEADVQAHNSLEKGVWVSYKEGVYDITKFIESHPGGNKILMGAGQSIEPFWHIYPVHFNSEVFEILEGNRIGNLKATEITVQQQQQQIDDPFKNDPPRHGLLKVLSKKPFNAETPIQFAADNPITPNELHFKRNHLPVPKIDVTNYKLELVNSLTNETKTLTLEDVRTKFKVYTVPVTLQCAGNRRKDMHGYKAVQGLMWDVNAISTAEWTGVKLKDILEFCQFDLKGVKHVQFEGLDCDPSGSTYGASVPIEKVVSDIGDVLVAFQMNNQDIPLDHGYPLRLVAPGVIGARSVKWLSKVVVSDKESSSHWQRNDYKLLSPNVATLNEADFTKIKAIQESPVQSAICEPQEGAVLKKDDESVTVKGYAYSGGGNSIESVMVSLDNGQTWKMADLKKIDQPLYRSWAWTLWELDVDIPKDKEDFTILCVATDSSENTQPETVKSIWNLRGLLNNSWHRVNVKCK